MSIYRSEEAVGGQAASLLWLGRALANGSDPEGNEEHVREATRCFEESLRLFTQLGNWVGVGWSRTMLSILALWNDDLDRAEQLANQVIEDCGAADVRHPMGQALCNLAYVASRRGDDDVALDLARDAVAVHRDLNDPWQLAGMLIALVAQATGMGRDAEALQALAESSQLDERIGLLPGRTFRLAVAACIHLARGQRAMSTAALAAYDAHPVEATGWGRPGGGGADVGHFRLLADAVATTRARLDAGEVAAATAAARRKSLDELIDELIIQPAMEAAV